MISKLDRVFTVATSTNANGPVNLLFTSLEKNTDIFSLKTMQEIVNDPVFKQIMSTGAALFKNLDDTYPQLLATNDITTRALSLLEESEDSDHILIYSPDDGIQQINLHDTYYACLRPERMLVGCVECGKNGANKKDCNIKQLTRRYFANEGDRWTPEDVATQLKSRKSKINNFTYVSPRLTAHKEFATMYRPVDGHDFSFIETRSEIVVKGLKERHRLKQFKQEACSVCLVKEICNDRWDKKHCKGPYAVSSKEATPAVLREVNIPFTNTELTQLLYYSGLLPQRYKRMLYWATFTIENHTLLFCLRRQTTSSDLILLPPNFKAIKSFLAKHDLLPATMPTKLPRISTAQKALLVELASIPYSPTRRAGWRTVAYPVIGIEYDPSTQVFTTSYRCYNCQVLHWNLKISELTSIFKYYGNFTHLHHTIHPKNHSIFHKRRYCVIEEGSKSGQTA